MEQNNWSTINLSQKELRDIKQFCELNKIEDVPSFLYACWRQGYEIEKYGLLGKTGGIQEKRVETEVIQEKWVEIPVEVIKEVEKIVEVIKEIPVEVVKEVEKIVEVIKEVPVEIVKEIPVEVIVTKTEYISDDTKTNELLLTIQQLETEKQKFSTKIEEMVEEQRIFSTKTQEMENIFQNKIKELENREPEKVEIIVEKPITTIDNSKQKLLEETIQKLRNELQLKNKEINDLKSSVLELQKTNSSRAIYMDGSNLGKTIR